MKSFVKIGALSITAMLTFLFSACCNYSPSSLLSSSSSALSSRLIIPNDYNWQLENIKQYTLKDFSTKNYETSIYYTDYDKNGKKTICFTRNENIIGEFDGKKCISATFLKKAMPITFNYSDGILNASFRYLRIAMKLNSKNVLVFTPFKTYTEKLDTCVLSVDNDFYIPLELINYFKYCNTSLIGTSMRDSKGVSSQIIISSKRMGILVDKVPYFCNYSKKPLDLKGFNGTLIDVTKEGLGVYKQATTGNIYVDDNSVLYLYEAENQVVPQ